jgi:hypothetical protein
MTQLLDSIAPKKARGKPFQKGVSGNPKGCPVFYKGVKKEESSRNYGLIHKYGITLLQYNEILERQNGVCAICGKKEEKAQARKKHGEKVIDSLQVDHDHETGKIRGLLCYKCNTGIGKLMDSPDLLRKAARYIGYVVEE